MQRINLQQAVDHPDKLSDMFQATYSPEEYKRLKAYFFQQLSEAHQQVFPEEKIAIRSSSPCEDNTNKNYFYEIYDPNTKYKKRMIKTYPSEYKEPQGLQHTFNTCLVCRPAQPDKGLTEQMFVQYVEDYDLNELKYYFNNGLCTCVRCQSSVLNPTKYFTCPCCVGCLGAGKHYARYPIVRSARIQISQVSNQGNDTIDSCYTQQVFGRVLLGTVGTYFLYRALKP